MISSSSIFVRSGSRYTRISLEDIRYIEASRNYCKFYRSGTPVSVLTTLRHLEEALASYGFVRIHRGFLVSLVYVSAFDRETVYLDGHELPIGEHYYNNLLRHVSILGDPDQKAVHQTVPAKTLGHP